MVAKIIIIFLTRLVIRLTVSNATIKNKKVRPLIVSNATNPYVYMRGPSFSFQENSYLGKNYFELRSGYKNCTIKMSYWEKASRNTIHIGKRLPKTNQKISVLGERAP